MVAIENMEMPKNCGECDCSYEHEYCGACFCCLTGNDVLESQIDMACPLLEIEERKVGKWEHDKLFGECAYVCSFCHTIWTSSEIENMHYCPTCGAEMRGVENENN